MYQGLLNKVKEQGIPIYNNIRLLTVKGETDNRVKLIFENRQTVEANFAIRADSIHSKIRPYIIDTELVYSRSIGIIGLAVPKN